jgi:ankyrin repeat protein
LSTTDLSLAWNHAKNVTRTEWEELIAAHEKGSAEGAKALLAESVEPRNLGTIHFAEVRGEGSIVEVLLDAGVPVDIRNAVGQDALHCVSRDGHHAIVKKLLENGADINVKVLTAK